jgi:hypothetical protein
MNRDTAISEQLLNMVNQQNPWGTVDYNQTGTTTYTDASGKTVTLPKFTQTTKFTPEQQAIFDASQGAQGNMANIAQEQSGRIQQILSDPFEFNNQDAADWAYDLGMSRIRPEQERQQEQLRTQLINSGIRPGTAAWNAEMGRMTNANTDQMNQLMLTGRGQAFNEAVTTRAMPINELTALLTGSQVTTPAAQSGPTPQTGVAGVDYTGLVQDQYQAKLAAHQSKMGGLFGLLGAGLTAGLGAGGFMR